MSAFLHVFVYVHINSICIYVFICIYGYLYVWGMSVYTCTTGPFTAIPPFSLEVFQSHVAPCTKHLTLSSFLTAPSSCSLHSRPTAPLVRLLQQMVMSWFSWSHTKPCWSACWTKLLPRSCSRVNRCTACSRHGYKIRGQGLSMYARACPAAARAFFLCCSSSLVIVISCTSLYCSSLFGQNTINLNQTQNEKCEKSSSTLVLNIS